MSVPRVPRSVPALRQRRERPLGFCTFGASSRAAPSVRLPSPCRRAIDQPKQSHSPSIASMARPVISTSRRTVTCSPSTETTAICSSTRSTSRRTAARARSGRPRQQPRAAPTQRPKPRGRGLPGRSRFGPLSQAPVAVALARAGRLASDMRRDRFEPAHASNGTASSGKSLSE